MKKYTFRNYNDYIKDNPKGLWFKMKLYGWGWVPAKWQGWFVILVFVGILLLNGFYFSYKISLYGNPNASDLTLFFGAIVTSIAIVFLICYKKGEKPRWRWGK